MPAAIHFNQVRRGACVPDSLGRCEVTSHDESPRVSDVCADDAEIIDRCRVISESARDIIMLLHPDGSIFHVNPAAEEAYGRPASELIRMNIRDLRAEETRSYVSDQMQAAAERGTLFETWHLRRDGSAFPVEVSSRGTEIGGQPAVLSVIRDITARRDRDVERDRLLDELEVANRRLDGLVRIVSSAVGVFEIERLLPEVLATLRSVLHADAALFLQVEDGFLVVEAEDGAGSAAPAGTVLPLDEGFAGQVVARGDSLFVRDVQSSPYVTDIHREYGARSMVGVPLVLEGEPFAVLECVWKDERPLGDAEIAMLKLAAERLTSALVAAERYELTRRSELLNATASEVGSLMNSSLELDRVLPDALELAARVLGCDHAAFGSFSVDTWRLRCGFGMPDELSVTMPFHEAFDADPRAPLPTVHVRSSSRRGEWLHDSFGFEEAVVVPVPVRGEWFGALVFGATSGPILFDDLAAEFLKRVSATVSLAFANFTDYEEEHRIAETLQTALLKLPERVEGVRHAALYSSSTVVARVGGDFYDLFSLPGGLVGAVMGDVSGKGLDAAVLTSVIKDTVRAYAQVSPDPGEVMDRANTALRAAARLPDFASALFCVIDPRTGECEYCCAGHPPGLVLRADGRVDELSCGSPVIGAFLGLEYGTQYARLAQGDILIMYTDGLTEARSASGEFYGDEELARAIKALGSTPLSEVPRTLFDVVASFAGGTLADDVAILAVSLDADEPGSDAG